MSRSALLLGASLLLALPASAQNDPSFHGMGDLAGGAVESAAEAVSADGLTVTGWSESGASIELVRWTLAGGLEGLGAPGASDPFALGHAISGDGSVLSGTAGTNSGARAFRWTQGSGFVLLGTFGCSPLCDPAATGEGISSNGLVVVGSGLHKTFFGDPHVDAARWTGGGTGIDDIGDLSGGGDASIAYGASSDGSLIVGEGDASAGPSAFRWTSGGGMVALPVLPGTLHNASALAVSSDGGTIVGYSNASASSSTQLEPVRWVGPGFATAENLGALPGLGSARGRALAVNGDGSQIVGFTRDAQSMDVAFLWDAVNGMRELRLVLEDEYGLDLTGWSLDAALSISDPNAFGEVTIVGNGTNPSGDPEGFIAILSPTECNDGVDNDSDTDVDFPDDPECTAPGDRSEGPDCSDGLDNDGDGQIDLADGDCTGAGDLSELADCQNGFDDDGDGMADYPADPGCRSPDFQHEAPECDDGIDNDSDGDIDGADGECLDPSDTSEKLDCDDGADNDADGLIDLADPDCLDAADPSEDPACFDFVDNDGDGVIDYPAAYPGCSGLGDVSESAECNDGLDNDLDSDTDLDDLQCPGPLFPVEAPATPALGDVLVVDQALSTLFALDPVSGAEQVLSLDAQLVGPEGIALRPDGRIVVSSPSGLLEIEPRSGAQAFRSAALTSVGGMPLEVDSAGDPVVLEADRISRVSWNPSGTGPATPLLTLPAGDLGIFVGLSLTLEDDDTAFTTGFGVMGDGVFRVDLGAGTATQLVPGFEVHVWRDLTLENASTLLAVGRHALQGEGVFRIDTGTGAITTLSTDPAWVQVEAVAVDASGDIFVADSGTCSEGACSGGLVATVDPVSGTRTLLRSGIFAGLLDLTVWTAQPSACDDGLDGDGDGLTDFPADPGCASAADADEHDPTLPCDDGADNDSDGLADFPADPGCLDPEWSLEDPQCDDDIDNDMDGKIDWDGGSGGATPDPQCNEKPHKKKEKAGCGLGFELSMLLPLLLGIRRRVRR